MKRSLALVLSFVMAMLLCVTAVAFTVNAEETNPCVAEGTLTAANVVLASSNGTDDATGKGWWNASSSWNALFDGATNAAGSVWLNDTVVTVVITLDAEYYINSIKVDSDKQVTDGWGGSGYTDGYKVYLSTDGETYGDAYEAAENGTSVDVYNITVGASAKYIKLECRDDVASAWWAGASEVTIKALVESHEWDEGTTTAEADCENAGSIHYECANCDATKDVEVPALGHDWDEGVVTAEATCIEEGNTHYECSRCDATKDEPIALTGHTISAESYTVLEAPSCTKAGKITGTCAVCEAVIEEANAIEIPALDHNYGEFVVSLEPTCTAKGSKSKICVSCGDVVTEEIAALGDKAHVYDPASYTDVVPASCKAAGSAKANCVICGAEGVEIEIPQLAHTYSEALTYVTLEPACLTTGKQVKVCAVCGEAKEETVSALGHDYGDWEIVEEATCAAKGTRTKTCSRCEAVKTEKYLLAHELEEKITVAPTCTAAGEKALACKNCDYKENVQVLKATGHALSNREVAPTCELAGYVEEVCANCDYSVRKSELAALGHQYEEVRVEPTEEAEGSVNKQCKVCGALDPSFEAQVLPKVKKSFIDMILEFFASLFGGKD